MLTAAEQITMATSTTMVVRMVCDLLNQTIFFSSALFSLKKEATFLVKGTFSFAGFAVLAGVFSTLVSFSVAS